MPGAYNLVSCLLRVLLDFCTLWSKRALSPFRPLNMDLDLNALPALDYLRNLLILQHSIQFLSSLERLSEYLQT